MESTSCICHDPHVNGSGSPCVRGRWRDVAGMAGRLPARGVVMMMSDESAPDFREGTVTRVAVQEKDRERVSVFLDDEFAFGLTLDLAIEAGLRPGLRLTVAEQEHLVERERLARGRVVALDYLSSQARTGLELRRKLRRKGYDAAVVDQVMEYVESKGYIDDAAYARAYVQARFAGRGHGPMRLRQELIRRGVAKEHIDDALHHLVASEEMDDAALAVARPRWRALESEADPRRRRQKTLDFLMRRGFDFDEARQAVERLAGDDGEDGADSGSWPGL